MNLRFPCCRYRTFLLFGFLLALGCAQQPAADENPPPAPVKVVGPRSLIIAEWTELLGSTQPLPDHAARISAAVEGKVVSVPGNGEGAKPAEGREVRAGETIVQLDDRVLRANKEKTEASFRELAEQKKQADIAVEIAQLTLKSNEGLRKMPGQLVVELQLEMARLALADAQSKLKGIVARQEAGEKELKALEEQLQLYTLRAPIAGRLGLVQVVPGQVVHVGDLIADVINLDEIDVLCFVPPYVAARLALDQPARISADGQASGTASSAEGKLVFLAVQGQPENGNFAVKVRFPNKDSQLRANAVQRVGVQTQPEKERLTIPETALMEDQDPPAVVIVENLEKKKNAEGKEEQIGKARKLRAKIGLRDRNWHVVEILGLEDPEKKTSIDPHNAHFVVEGGHGLQDGDVVKLEEEEEEEK